MKNSADLGGCYPPRPSVSVDNTLFEGYRMVNPRLCETARPLFKNPNPRLKKLLNRSIEIFRVYGTVMDRLQRCQQSLKLSW